MMGRSDAKASLVHAAMDTLGNLLALLVTPANEQDRAQVGELARAVQEVTGQTVELAFVDQGYTGDTPAQEAKEHGMQLEVVKLPEAKRGFVPAFTALGGGAFFCLGHPFPTAGARL
jgi:transposase